jgi:hypothetical protein
LHRLDAAAGGTQGGLCGSAQRWLLLWLVLLRGLPGITLRSCGRLICYIIGSNTFIANKRWRRFLLQILSSWRS